MQTDTGPPFSQSQGGASQSEPAEVVGPVSSPRTNLTAGRFREGGPPDFDTCLPRFRHVLATVSLSCGSIQYRPQAQAQLYWGVAVWAGG